ncbi:MAG: type II toxin-antitoxin system HicB family antitoxin [Chloroflexi bacterium]|nr:type II toxin-antitoxin system HicB family antitoxin [Chloroflexota bacterium]
MKFPVVVVRGQDGYYVTECPVLPGCVTQGKTKAEALANVKEAILLCLESAQEEGWQVPEGYELEEVEVSASA